MILRQELTRALNDALFLSLQVAMGGFGLCRVLLCLFVSCVLLEGAGQEKPRHLLCRKAGQSLDLRDQNEPGRGVPRAAAHHRLSPG